MRDFDHSLHTNLFSSSKVFESLIFSTLFDKGLFEYSDTVCKWWPEFALRNKEKVTIEDVMKHEAGLYGPCFSVPLQSLTRQGLRTGVLATNIAETPLQ
mmetsp:Transcript_79077/g.170895  ORF Transcript_79077/g.170895 Transcript_79077/m.170895 type:complete len:99 (-) Transcript_79077:760-1056(-)